MLFAVNRRSVSLLAFSNILKLQTRNQSGVANTKSSPAQLKAAVDSWVLPYTTGPLTKDEYNHFHEKGWVIKKDILSKKALENTIDSISDMVDQVAKKLYNAGKIKDLGTDKGFLERLTFLDKQFPHANVFLHKMGILPTGVQELWSTDQLLDVATQILGTKHNIDGHPNWNLRCKTPESTSLGQATVPWHQDTAYLDEECWDKLQLTCWVPLLDTNIQNGCMQVLSGGHKTGITATHTGCTGGTWYVELSEQEIEKTLNVNIARDTATCEVPFGSVLFLNNLVPHRSLPNNTEHIRWSLDLRWQRAGEPNGLWGVKSNILMRDHKNPNHKIDWKGWATVEKLKTARTLDTDFDTTITGPWMRRWEITNENRHTKAWKQENWA
eukprot:c21533_g3_i1.p1 GENE.c21533_g3_i1~~c21533_g3_i1.p1  ORF type:complete len:390 (+),score=149.40 c21533_g3_i1:23-1171(+)